MLMTPWRSRDDLRVLSESVTAVWLFAERNDEIRNFSHSQRDDGALLHKIETLRRLSLGVPRMMQCTLCCFFYSLLLLHIFFSHTTLHMKLHRRTIRENQILRTVLFRVQCSLLYFSMQMMHNNNGVCRFSTYLLQYRSDVLQRQRRKLILLQEVVQVLLEHLKYKTCVVLVLEALEGAHKIELVGVFLAEA